MSRHPPLLLNLYVASGITKTGIAELTIAVLPWLLTMLGFLLVVTFFPKSRYGCRGSLAFCSRRVR